MGFIVLLRRGPGGARLRRWDGMGRGGGWGREGGEDNNQRLRVALVVNDERVPSELFAGDYRPVHARGQQQRLIIAGWGNLAGVHPSSPCRPCHKFIATPCGFSQKLMRGREGGRGSSALLQRTDSVLIYARTLVLWFIFKA